LKTLLKIALFVLFISFLFVSTQFLLVYVDELKANERKLYLDETAHNIVKNLTLEEKIGQVIHVAIPGKTLDKIALEEIESIRPGGVIHFGKNLGTKKEIISLNQSLQDLARKLNMPPLLISTDQEGGRVFRVRDGVAQFPGAMAVGQTNQESIGYQVGFVTSYDLNKVGINFLLAPSLDVNNNPNNPVINTRSFGSDVTRVSRVAGAYERGAREGGAIPVIKHFPGHGDTDVDSHIGLPIIRKSLEELEKLELIPFQESIQSGAPVVMSAHILFPKLDEKYPATLSKKILQGILRDRLKFEGVVITDAMEMHAISKNYQNERPGVLALLAGADILLLTSWGENSRSLFKSLLLAAQNGDFNQNGINVLDQAVYRQIRLKLEYGIYTENGFSPKIDNANLSEFMAKAAQKRNEEYAKITSSNDFVFNITKETIRSYPREFKPIPLSEISQVSCFFNNSKFKKSYQSLGGKCNSLASLRKEIKNSQKQIFLFEANSEKDLKNIENLAIAYPNKRMIVLYSITPFIILPNQSNLDVLFSFSLTEESYRALVEAVFQKKSVPKMDLVLKTNKFSS
jgi:beta-N-acetylhexosaminidase